MGIISEQSLGGIRYVTIDDAYPDYSSSTKTIAINNAGRIFSNVPYSSIWIPMERSSYAEALGWEINTNSTFLAADNNIWYLMGTLAPMSAGTLNGFSVVTPTTTTYLSANTDTIGRYLFTSQNTFELVTSADDEMNWEMGISLNNSIPTWGVNGGCLSDRTSCALTMFSTRILNINGNLGDIIAPVIKFYIAGGTTSVGGQIRVKNTKIAATLMEEPSYMLNEGFETGSPNWVTVNGVESNKWIINSGNSYNGNYSAYISNDNINNTYTASAKSITHIYKDMYFPKGTPSSFLSLAYRSNGSAGYISGSTPGIQLSEDWETGNFGSWTTVNAATNAWFVGTATSSGGTNSAYISNNGGVANTYTNTLTQISHFYRDIQFPDGASTLSFNWRCWGENGAAATAYDYGSVVLTTTSTLPVAGTEVSTTQATSGGNGRIGATSNLGKFNLGYGGADSNWRTETIDISSWSGQTKRLVFTWVNDSSIGSNPPFAVDNIVISGLTGGTNVGGFISLSPTTFTPSAGSPVPESYKVGSTVYSGQSAFTTSLVTLASDTSLSGTTKRIIFTWVNTGNGVVNNPPFNIDLLKVYTYTTLPNDKI